MVIYYEIGFKKARELEMADSWLSLLKECTKMIFFSRLVLFLAQYGCHHSNW